MRTAQHASFHLAEISEPPLDPACTAVHFEYTIAIRQRPDLVFALLTDVARWPAVFDHCRSGVVMGHNGDRELIEIRAMVGGREHAWRSLRHVDPGLCTIGFQQLTVYPPIAALAGSWCVASDGEHQALVTLVHDFTVLRSPRLPTVADATDWLSRTTRESTAAHLEALKAASERALGIA
jgi:aromatase